MKKKIRIFIKLVIILYIFLIALVLEGWLVKSFYHNSDRFIKFQNVAVFLANLPSKVKKDLLSINEISTNVQKITPGSYSQPSRFHFDYNQKKETFKLYQQHTNDGLLLLSHFDSNLQRFVFRLKKLTTFENLIEIIPNFKSLISNGSSIKAKNLKFTNPLIDEDLNIITSPENGPLIKFNSCGDIVWKNDDFTFHHSKNFDSNGNIIVPIRYKDKKIDKIFFSNERYNQLIDEGIAIVDPLSGKVLYEKSLTNILIENNYHNKIFGNLIFTPDLYHMNDIEPALSNSEYWNKGDLFISLATQSTIIQFRPETNKIIRIINGPFYRQHDIDILDDTKISIFNNNQLTTFEYFADGEIIKDFHNEVIIYDFEKNTYENYINEAMRINKVATATEGLSEILNEDNSILIEDQNSGRLVYFDSEGSLIWEFINKDPVGNIYQIGWSRLLSNFEVKRDKICSN